MKKDLLKIPMLLCFGMVFRLAAGQSTTFSFTHNQPAAALVANAGADATICDGSSTPIGGSPTGSGGTPPFAYDWLPTSDLSLSTAPNPDASPTGGPTSVDYMITITDSRGCTASDTMTVTVDTCAGIGNPADIGTSSIFPNPNNGNFVVEVKLVNQPRLAKITILSIDGKQVYSRDVTASNRLIREEIKLAGLSKGNYIVNIDIDDARLSHKIIIQ